MAILKLAAGVAIGYVLGSRAGRERYEQIAETARKVSAHPTVVQAQEQAKSLIGTGVDKVKSNTGTSGTGTSGSGTSGSGTSGSGTSSTREIETTTVLDHTSEAPGPVVNKRKRVTAPAPVTPATTTVSSDPVV